MADLNPQLTLPVADDAELAVEGEDVERAPGDVPGDQDASLVAPVADIASSSAPVVEPAPSDDEPVYVVDRTEA